MAWWTTILPVVTLLLGAGGTLFTEQARDKRQLARERSLRLEQRSTAREDRREDFELTTLKKLYEALDRLGRAMTRIHLIDSRIGTRGYTEPIESRIRTSMKSFGWHVSRQACWSVSPLMTTSVRVPAKQASR
jgi:hypothetical protein